MGWVTGSTADRMATNRAESAVVSRRDVTTPAGSPRIRLGGYAAPSDLNAGLYPAREDEHDDNQKNETNAAAREIAPAAAVTPRRQCADEE